MHSHTRNINARKRKFCLHDRGGNRTRTPNQYSRILFICTEKRKFYTINSEIHSVLAIVLYHHLSGKVNQPQSL